MHCTHANDRGVWHMLHYRLHRQSECSQLTHCDRTYENDPCMERSTGAGGSSKTDEQAAETVRPAEGGIFQFGGGRRVQWHRCQHAMHGHQSCLDPAAVRAGGSSRARPRRTTRSMGRLEARSQMGGEARLRINEGEEPPQEEPPWAKWSRNCTTSFGECSA